jgi:hypothetical protein
MDGFCNQNADQLGYLAGPSRVTVYVGVVECVSLPPASSSFTHARRMDGFCNQNADQLGYLAGPSKHWAPFKALRQRFAGMRFEEQRQLHRPQKHKATVQDSALRVEMLNLEEQADNAKARELY